MIESGEIAEVVGRYVERHPTERDHIRPLLELIRAGATITSGSAYPGHVTCSALVVNDEGRMLRIWHNSFGKWLQPGGHLEPSDTSLVGAALRELAEETGIALDPAALLDNQPIDVDVHAIPANRTRGEPKHQHFDLRRSSAELAVPRDRGRVGEARDLVDDDA